MVYLLYEAVISVRLYDYNQITWNTCFKITEATYRSSHPEVFLRKGVLKIYSKFTREHPCRSVISIKLLWATDFRNTYGWMLLYLHISWKKLINKEAFIWKINVMLWTSKITNNVWCILYEQSLTFINKFHSCKIEGELNKK